MGVLVLAASRHQTLRVARALPAFSPGQVTFGSPTLDYAAPVILWPTEDIAATSRAFRLAGLPLPEGCRVSSRDVRS